MDGASGEFAVIGLGQFGRALALNLVRDGHSVLAIDVNPERAQMVEAEVEAVVVADATLESALEELGLERTTCTVVAMGRRARETSIMVTALLRQRGVPRIISRTTDDLHARVLRAVGAHEVINPEFSAGVRSARHLAAPNVFDQLALTRFESVAHVRAPEALHGVTCSGFVAKFRVELLAVVRSDRVVSRGHQDLRIEPGDDLLLLGTADDIRRFTSMD